MSVPDLAPQIGPSSLEGRDAGSAATAPRVQAEMLVVFRAPAGHLGHLAHEQGPSWRLACHAGMHPHTLVLQNIERLGLRALVVHSTSWRLEADQLLLTYLVAVRAQRRWPDPLRPIPTSAPRRLTQGSATAAPERLVADDVLVHALRHLAWLYFDDAAVKQALGPRWRAGLRPYLPAPFMALTRRPSRNPRPGR